MKDCTTCKWDRTAGEKREVCEQGHYRLFGIALVPNQIQDCHAWKGEAMNDCTTCRWDIVDNIGERFSPSRRMHCQQGHYRPPFSIISNCHVWEEKGECECYKTEEYIHSFLRDPIAKVLRATFICKQCGRVIG